MSLYLIKVLYKNDLYKYTVNKGLQVTFINLNLLYKENDVFCGINEQEKNEEDTIQLLREISAKLDAKE